MNEKAQRTADENKAVVTGFKEDDDETEVRILLEKIHRCIGHEESRNRNRVSCKTDHTCFPGIQRQ